MMYRHVADHDAQLTTLRRLFELHWNGSRDEAQPTSRAGSTRRRIADHCCPIGILRDNLLRLLAENHEREAAELAPQVRCMIADRDFAGDGGDEALDPHHDFLMDRYAEAIIEALETVRLQAMEQGIWSFEPVTPQMFG